MMVLLMLDHISISYLFKDDCLIILLNPLSKITVEIY